MLKKLETPYSFFPEKHSVQYLLLELGWHLRSPPLPLSTSTPLVLEIYLLIQRKYEEKVHYVQQIFESKNKILFFSFWVLFLQYQLLHLLPYLCLSLLSSSMSLYLIPLSNMSSWISDILSIPLPFSLSFIFLCRLLIYYRYLLRNPGFLEVVGAALVPLGSDLLIHSL